MTTLAATSASAAGWGSIHRFVKPTGKCSGQEVLASWYAVGKRTANGEAFNSAGHTAAARTWPMGTKLNITNPHNGRVVQIRINDLGPWGIAFRQGVRLDLARGAAQHIGMHGSQYVCVSAA